MLILSAQQVIYKGHFLSWFRFVLSVTCLPCSTLLGSCMTSNGCLSVTTQEIMVYKYRGCTLMDLSVLYIFFYEFQRHSWFMDVDYFYSQFSSSLSLFTHLHRCIFCFIFNSLYMIFYKWQKGRFHLYSIILVDPWHCTYAAGLNAKNV